MDKRALLLLLWLFLQFSLGVASKNKSATHNVSISRDHVFVWFQSPLQEETKYDKETLKEMIDLVGGTFGAILINPVTQVPKLASPKTLNDSLLMFPSLVAQHNQRGGNKTLKVYLSLSMPNNTDPKHSFGQGNNSFILCIEVAKLAANRANSIYPGTVDTLLLLDKDSHPSYKATEHAVNTQNYSQNGMYILQTLKSARKLLQNESDENTYRLGLVSSFSTFLDNEQILSEILESVDLIVPLNNLNGIYMDSFEERESLYFEHNYGHFEKTIRDMKSDVEIVPLLSCDPPVNKDFEEVSIFLNCWEFMSDWAKKNNRSVIMFEAFDQNGDERKLKDAGWWRLKSETSSGGIRRFDRSSFFAKADDTYGINMKFGDKFSFQATIYFDYRVRDRTARNQDYTKKEVREMLKLVSSRFSSIVIGSKPGDDLLDEIPNVLPSLVAQLNQEKFKKNPSFSPVTIISNIRHDKLNWGIRNLNWDRTWRAAKKANEIFPGTVRIIAFDRFGKGDVYKNWINFLIALKDNYGKNTISTHSNFTPPTFTNIRIGAYLDLSDCPAFLKNEFPTIRKWVTVLIVDISGSISSEFQHHYVDYKLSRLFVEWRKCQQSFKSNYPNVEVLLSVSCSQLVGNGSNEQEAKCWEIVHDWSHTNQVQVIFHQAFETVNGTGGKSPDLVGGWWKLIQSGQLSKARDSFVEKFEDLMRDTETTSSDDSADRTNLNGTVLIPDSMQTSEKTSYNNGGDVVRFKDDGHTGLVVLFIVILVVGCTSTIILTVYWYKRRKQQLTVGINEMELIQT